MKGKAFRCLPDGRNLKILYLLLVTICCFPIVSAPGALLLGLSCSLLLGNPFRDIVDKWSLYLLKAAVIGFGFGIDIHVLMNAGREHAGTTAAFVIAALAAGMVLGFWLKIDKMIALLISVGTAICGGSAIAAVGSAIKANSGQLSISMSTIFLLNILGLFIFPEVGHWLGLTQEQFGHWAAIAIHDTSSVVGAALKYGDEALKVASVSKMLRILWIIPFLLVLVIGSPGNGRTLKFPLFIIGFILASCAFSFIPSGQKFFQGLYAVSKQLMVICLFLIGSAVSLKTLKQVGGKVLIQAIVLWIAVSIAALVFVRYL